MPTITHSGIRPLDQSIPCVHRAPLRSAEDTASHPDPRGPRLTVAPRSLCRADTRLRAQAAVGPGPDVTPLEGVSIGYRRPVDERPGENAAPGGRVATVDSGGRATRDLDLYVAVAVAASAVSVVVLQLWRASLDVPFDYQGDAVSFLSSVKGMIEHGWVWENPSLGAPGTANLLDFPTADLLNVLIIRVLAWITRDPATTVNLFYLLGYPVIAISSLWSFRRLGVSRATAAALSLLFTFVPYHLFRGEQHLFLASYWFVPPALVLALGLMGHAAPLVAAGRLRLRVRAAVGPLVLAVAIGMSGIYYAFFTCFLLVVAGVWGWRTRQELARLKAAAVLVGTVAAGALVALAPYLGHRLSAGANPGAVIRSLADLEVWGLKISQLILPVRHHRIEWLADVRSTYQGLLVGLSGPRADNEADWAALGFIGAVGLVLLLLAPLLGNRRSRTSVRLTTVRSAAVLAVASILLATTSGFNVLVGHVLPEIRSYNRISIFIAFLALLAVGLVLDGALEGRGRRGHLVTWLAAAVLVAVGLFDQTTPAMVPRYEDIRSEWRADRAFVARVEATLPGDTRVFQVPFTEFPEGPTVGRMAPYDHFKPYFHSSQIHWSFGAMKGREDSTWQRAVAGTSPTGMVATLRDAGFGGLWIDRVGYSDDAKALLAQVEDATGNAPLLSEDGKHAYVPLR